MSGGDNSAHTGSEIGRTLELARRERGLSLKEAEEATKIRAAYLAELERENFSVLPAVYVQGSLRTYANFLQLDGEEMVRELKRREDPREEPSYPLYVGPREDDSLDDILVALGGAAGVERQDGAEDEEVAGPALLPAGITDYLYLGSALVLVLAVAAAALALTAAQDGRQAVSQVREPLISQAPETSPPDIAEENAGTQQREPKEEQRSGDEGGKDEESDQRAQTEQAQGDSGPAQVPASATASASAAAERDAASSSATTEKPAERTPVNARATPPVRQDGTTGAPASPPAAGGGRAGGPSSSGSGDPPARDDGGLEVRVRVGAEDPVRLSGGPFDD